MKAQVKITFDMPIGCTKKELRDWVLYELRLSERIKVTNPLNHRDLSVMVEFGDPKVQVKKIKDF